MNLVFTLFLSFLGFFTSPSTTPVHPKAGLTNCNLHMPGEKVWKTEYQDDRVLIESCLVVYTGSNNALNQQRIVFRYTNRTSKNLQLSFGRKMFYNGVCYGCEKSDKSFRVDLMPHESKEYSDQNKNKTYYIFSKDLNNTIKKTLDSFELTNIETLTP